MKRMEFQFENAGQSGAFCVYCETSFKDDDARWDGRAPAEVWHFKCASRVGLTTQAQKLTGPVALTAPTVNNGRRA
jgi:hypothetical protein